MLGLQFVVWRDQDGRARCISNTCERIPSLGPLQQTPERGRIDAYPVEERYGLIFVFLGDLPEDKRPTIMSIKEYEERGWRMDLDELRRNKGRVAYAVPSPGRGENPHDWAITRVPVLNQ